MELNQEWKNRIERAKAWMSKYEKNYKQNVEIYNGKRKYFKEAKYEYYANIIWQTYQTEKANIIPSSLQFYVEVEQNYMDYELNMLVSELLNNIFSNSKNIKLTEKLHTQAVCKGVGVGMVAIREKNKIVKKIDKEGKIAEKESEIFLKIFKTEDVLYDKDMEVDDFEDLKWIAASFYIPAVEFEKYDYYINKRKIYEANGLNVDVNGKLKYEQSVYGGYAEGSDEKYYPIKIWEVWDTIERKKYYIEDKSGEFAMEPEDYPIENPDFNHPFVFLSFTDGASDSFPPPAEIDMLKILQDCYNAIRSAQKRDINRMIRKMFALEDTIDKNEENKLLNLDRDQIIKVSTSKYFPVGQTPDIRNLLMPAPENPMPPQADGLLMGIKYDFMETSGYGPSERGGLAPASTATESRQLFQMLTARSAKKAQKIFDLWQSIAKKALFLIEELFPDEVNIKVAKYGQPAVWKKLNLKEIRNKNKEIKVYVGTKGNVDKQRYITEALQTANILFPIAQNYGLDLSMLVRKILTLMEWSPDEVETIFKHQRDKAKAIAMALAQYAENGMDEIESAKFLGMISDFLMSYLSPNEIAEIQGKFAATGGKPPAQSKTSGINSQRTTKLDEDIGKGVI